MTASDVPEPVTPTDPGGLSSAEVRARIERGLTNQVEETTSRTVGEIVRAVGADKVRGALPVLREIRAMLGED